MPEYAIITGASQGIGAAIAEELAAQGIHPVMLARNILNLKAVADTITSRGGQCSFFKCDVGVAAEIESVTGDLKNELGKLPAILVNNAGYGGPFHRTDEVTEAEWDLVFDTNVKAAFLFSKILLPAMKQQGWGRIINIASVYGSGGGALSSAYAASKHALIGYSKSLALEWGDHNITVNCISPGYIETKMGASAREGAPEKITSQIPAGRQGTPAEIARLVYFLSRPENGYINGADIIVDGGLSAGFRFA